ncbi:MAG: hypothetical protein JEY96_02430 [Bacteroidales bacterium]|nr:hypothetical protein [Bacteroidales bacterium]
MIYMLCRNLVKDFTKWKAIFDSQLSLQEDSGLILKDLWTELDNVNNVFFIFEVTNMQKAKELINDPESAKVGERSGVIDGECHFIEK